MNEDRLAPPTFDPADAAAAAARFAATAPADVHYALVDSPIGTLVAAATPRGLVTLSYEDRRGGGTDAVLDWVAAKLSPRMLEAPAKLDGVRRELDEYFEGRRRAFDLPIDWALTGDFTRRVLKATAAIPFGQVSTYGAVAAEAGNPKASRAAGRALGANPIPIVVPCHRVIGTNGRLTGYTGGLDRKIALLELEGIVLPG
ncbi:MAG TPA: methylated-DNA--[protein]-cysteine S-methyltransferase [Solirubrobacteraceae bacterium]|jgi:methylated-DNA-[protein]-cysteine S-methyltransferase|nr:methylated-DNA--[protein]-cysteine S-methyltransferase [Solirubrobacteraceae bacterium]